MPCRDHEISLRVFLAGLFRGPLGTSYSSGKGFPEAPSVADAPNTCEKISQAFSVVPGGLLIHRGKYSPRPLRSLTLRIPAKHSQAFSVVPGGLLIHRGKYSPRPLRSLTLRIPAKHSQAFSVVPGGLPIHRGKAAGLRCLSRSDFNAEAKVRPIAPSLPGRSSSREEHRGSARCCLR